jgi:hypothetical protein
MKIVFKVNLGSIDAKSLGIDHIKCMIGKTCDVSTAIAEQLITQGIAESADTPIQPAKDLQLKTVAEEPKLKGVK